MYYEETRGERLRKIRERRGFTQVQVLDMLRKDFNSPKSAMWLYRLENDKVGSLKREDQLALSKIYAVTPDYILFGGKKTLDKVHWFSPKIMEYIENPKNKDVLESTIEHLMELESKIQDKMKLTGNTNTTE